MGAAGNMNTQDSTDCKMVGRLFGPVDSGETVLFVNGFE